MARTYEVAFRITGALNGQFAAAMQAAQNAMRGLSNAARQVNSAMAGSMGTLQGYLSKLNSMAAQSDKFGRLKASLAENQRAMQAEIAKAGQLSAAYRQQKAQVDAMRDAYKALTDRQQSLKQAYDNEKSALQSSKAQLASLTAAHKQAELAFGRNSQKARELKTQLDNLKATIASQSASVQNAKLAYDNFKASMKGASAELKAAESALKNLGTSFGASKSKVQELYNTLKRQKAELESLKSSLAAAGFSTDHFIASEMKLRSEIAATTAAIERQRQAAASLTAAQNNLNSASTNFGEAQSAFNSVQQAVDTIAAPIKKSVETAMTFEHAMSRVKALTQSQNIREGKTDVVQKEFAALEQQALDLGATTQFTAIQAAEAMGFLGMAGWKTEQILGTMPGMLDLAAAAGADLAQTADIVSDNMTAMGVPVKDAPHFMDVYAYALTNSNARLTDFGETMKYAAPVAKAFGSSLDETAAMVMMMANAGIKGSMAGTSLRMGLLRLAGPPKTATKEMEKLGLSLSDAQAGALEAQAVIEGLGIDLQGATSPAEKMTRVIMQLHEKTKDLSQDEKLAAFKGIFGVNAETGWLALFDQGPEVFLKYVEGLRNADGYSRQVAQTMMDDTQGAITLLESSMEGAYTAVGRALTPAIRGAAEAVTPLISAFAQWANANPAIIQGVVGIIAALSGLALAVAGVAVAFTAWSFITSQIAMISAGMAAVRGGMLATEIASMGMAARIGAAYATMSASVTGAIATLRGITWSGLFAGLTAQLAAARVAVTGFFASLSVGSIASGVAAALSKVATAIMGVTRAALAFAFSPIGVALMALALAAYVIYQNWDRLVPVFSSVGSAISSALSAAASAVGNLVSALGTVGEALLSAFQALDNVGGGDVIIRIFLGIVNVLAGVAVSIINIFSSVVNTVAHMFDGLGKAISAALEGEFSEAAGHMKDTLSNIQNDWKNIHFSKLDFGYDIGANYQKSLETYQNARVTQPVQQTAAQPSAMSQAAQIITQPAAIPAPAESAPAQAPNVDTSSFMASMQALGTAAEQPAQTLPQIGQGAEQANQALANFPQTLQPTQEALVNFPQSLQPTQDALANFPQSILPAQEGMSTFGNAALTAAPSVGQLGTASQLASGSVGHLGNTSQLAAGSVGHLGNTSQLAAGSVGFLGETSQGAAGSVGHLGSTAGGAAGNVGQLGTAAMSVVTALQGAAAKISSINITVPTITVGGAAPAANYKGGIYDKGAFLTWFAEKSPEAAIPLDKSQRAINLWTQAGQMLGVLPNDSPINTPSAPIQSGSTRREIISVQREKLQRAQKVYNSVVNQQQNSLAPKILTERERYGSPRDNLERKLGTTLSRIVNLQRRVQNLQAAQFDELGNIIGLNGAAGNVITKYDSEQIKQVKQERQLKEFKEITEKQGGTSTFSRYLEKSRSIITRIRETLKPAESQSMQEVKMPLILTESQRWASENPAHEKTLERVANSRSYQAIVNAQRNTTRSRTSTSILNAPTESNLQTTLSTDRYQNLSIGGFNLRNIPFIGKIFDKANDALRGIFGKQPVDVFSGIGKNVDYEIMHPRGTFPTLPAESPAESNLQTSLPTDIFKNIGGIDLGNVPIIGGLIGKANDALRGIFGKQPVDAIGGIVSGVKNRAAYDIMHPTGTFPTLTAENSTSLLERVNTLQSSVLSNERLESVTPLESGTSAYSAETFQPTFNITVNITGGGENLDTQKIGERIAFSARESFEKEFETFMREKSRRSFV